MPRRFTSVLLSRLAAIACVLSAFGSAQAEPALTTESPPLGRPDAVIDLQTPEGVGLVGGQWRYSDVAIVEVEAKGPGPDLRPSGAPVRTYDYTPKAGAADFDDSSWETIDADTLGVRRAGSKLCFNWYRIAITVPERLGGFDPTGATVAFEVVVDDYAEVWVDGRLPVVLGETGGPIVKGFNAPNRVVIARDAKPGQRIQLAVFGINGPISASPDNFIWIKSATLDFYAPRNAEPLPARVLRADPALDELVPPGATIEKLAGGFQFTEGPVWVRDAGAPGPATHDAGAHGSLLFSDPNANAIYRWSPEGSLSVYRTKSGYAGVDIAEYGQPGSNGLALDGEGRVTLNQHGNRRVVRLERNGEVTVLADRYQGKRLNSPNDLVYKSDGSLYFTDPPFGLPRFADDPRKELPFSGVYRVSEGEVRLVADDLRGPNGLAFSPDERFLYVGNWDDRSKVVMRYPVRPDGSLDKGEVFFDMTSAPGEDAIDGIKVDRRGNLYVSGPGGIWILSAAGKHLGTVTGPEHPHNLAFGDDDGRTLYLTAQSGLYRMRVLVPGLPSAAS
jgi:gluconolactonase